MMRTYNLLGVVEGSSGRPPEARAWFEKSGQLAEKLKDQLGMGAAALNSGVTWQQEGDAALQQGNESASQLSFQAALRPIGESLKIHQSIGNKPAEASSLSQLAQIHLRLGDLANAEHHVHEARQLRESLGLMEVFNDYNTLSAIAAVRGDCAAAADWAQKRDAKLDELKGRARGDAAPSSD